MLMSLFLRVFWYLPIRCRFLALCPKYVPDISLFLPMHAQSRLGRIPIQTMLSLSCSCFQGDGS